MAIFQPSGQQFNVSVNVATRSLTITDNSQVTTNGAPTTFFYKVRSAFTIKDPFGVILFQTPIGTFSIDYTININLSVTGSTSVTFTGILPLDTLNKIQNGDYIISATTTLIEQGALNVTQTLDKTVNICPVDSKPAFEFSSDCKKGELYIGNVTNIFDREFVPNVSVETITVTHPANQGIANTVLTPKPKEVNLVFPIQYDGLYAFHYQLNQTYVKNSVTYVDVKDGLFNYKVTCDGFTLCDLDGCLKELKDNYASDVFLGGVKTARLNDSFLALVVYEQIKSALDCGASTATINDLVTEFKLYSHCDCKCDCEETTDGGKPIITDSVSSDLIQGLVYGLVTRPAIETNKNILQSILNFINA